MPGVPRQVSSVSALSVCKGDRESEKGEGEKERTKGQLALTKATNNEALSLRTKKRRLAGSVRAAAAHRFMGGARQSQVPLVCVRTVRLGPRGRGEGQREARCGERALDEEKKSKSLCSSRTFKHGSFVPPCSGRSAGGRARTPLAREVGAGGGACVEVCATCSGAGGRGTR